MQLRNSILRECVEVNDLKELIAVPDCILCSVIVSLVICVLVGCAGKTKVTTDEIDNGGVAETSSRTPLPFDSVFVKIRETNLSRAGTPPIGEVTQLSVGPNGRMLISDPAITRGVYLFTEDGDFLRRVGKYGTNSGEYLYPAFHGFDQSGRIYIYDGDRLVLLAFDQDGHYISSFFVGKYFHKIVFDSRSAPFFFTATYYDRKRQTDATVFHYTRDGQFLEKFCASPVFDGRAGYHGGGVAVDLDNAVYVISPYEYKIRKFGKGGRLDLSFGTPPSDFRFMPTSDALAVSRNDRESWHSSWTHIWNLMFFEKGFLMLWMEDFESKHGGQSSTIDYFDLYNLEGKLINSKVPLPDGGSNYCAVNNYLFSLKSSKARTDSTIIDHILCVYHLR